MKNYRKYLLICILFLGISVVSNGVMIGYAIQSYRQSKATMFETTKSDGGNLMTVQEVSEYLNIPSEEVLGIINTEQKMLEQYSVFSGRMFPHLIINGKYYFHIASVDEWLKEATLERRQYDTKKGLILR